MFLNFFKILQKSLGIYLAFCFLSLFISYHSALQLYTQASTKEWNEENQSFEDKISFQSKLQAK